MSIRNLNDACMLRERLPLRMEDGNFLLTCKEQFRSQTMESTDFWECSISDPTPGPLAQVAFGPTGLVI